MTSPASAATIVMQAGTIDGFALPADPASPSPEIAAFTSVQDFDLIANLNGGSVNTNIIHTFVGLPGGILGGTLEIPVEAGIGAVAAGIATDGVILLFVDDTTLSLSAGLAFSRTFGSFAGGGLFGPDPGLLKSGTWSGGDTGTILFDLAALPLAGGGTFDITPQLNANGFLDVLVGDETGADYFRLVLAVPEPSTLTLLTMSLLVLPLVAGRRRSLSHHLPTSLARRG